MNHILSCQNTQDRDDEDLEGGEEGGDDAEKGEDAAEEEEKGEEEGDGEKKGEEGKDEAEEDKGQKSHYNFIFLTVSTFNY